MNDCEHEYQRLTKMSHCKQARMQCAQCGQAIGNAIRHDLLEVPFDSLPEFDQEFRDLFWKRKQEIREERIKNEQAKLESIELDRKAEKESRRLFYEEYLQSEKWKAIRRLVIDRENGICQGCRKSRISEIHHATYDHLGDELLFELIGLCRDCHKKTHHIYE